MKNPPISSHFARPLLMTAVLMGALLVPLTHAQDAPIADDQVGVPVTDLQPLPATQEAMGTLDVEILIVDDLTPRPVPFTAFRVSPVIETAQLPAREVRTQANGQIAVQLPPGKYRFESVAPLKFKGKTYEWAREFEITLGQITPLHLTGEDATAHDDVPQTARVVADEAKIYRVLRDGVATIESERGAGTGFLVDARGVLLTNHHVVEGSRRLVVKFGSGLRAQATVLASDPQNDVAVIRVNPEISAGLPLIPLARPKPQNAGETAPSIAVEGEKVMAIGSPLGEEKILTTGLVSRVKAGLLISDVNINPGNSGGPFINMAGEAVGLTTFGQSAGSGPGLSGIVTLDRVLPTLDKALATLDKTPTLPSAQLLPDFSTVAIPANALDAAARGEIEVPLLKAPSAFETRFLTPYNLASLQYKQQRELEKKQAKRRGKSKTNVSETAPETRSRFYNERKAAVYIAITPKLVESKSSKSRGLLGGLLGGMTGTFIPTKRSMEFRHDFYDMQLLRDNVPVEPIQRQRVPTSIYFENLFIFLEAKDTANAGIYAYDPAAFAPGAELTLRVWREYNTEKPDTVKISPALAASLYQQFASHRTATQIAAASDTAQTLSLTAETSIAK